MALWELLFMQEFGLSSPCKYEKHPETADLYLVQNEADLW